MTEPLISVVVPTFARPERLRDCRGALARLDAGTDFEVVVVDDGSPHAVDHVVTEFQSAMAHR